MNKDFTSKAIDRIRAAGWMGVAIWKGEEGYLGCLMRPPSGVLAHDTTCWHHQPTAEEVLNILAAMAERHPVKQAKP